MKARVISPEGLNVRLQPKVTSTSLGIFEPNAEVEVIEVQGAWAALALAAGGARLRFGNAGVRVYAAAEFLDFGGKPDGTTPAKGFALGLNCMYSESAAREAVAAGCRFVVLMESIAGAVNIAREFPHVTAVTRRTLEHGILPDPADFVGRCGVAADWPANVVIVGLNEDDQIAFNANLERRFQWDSEVARRIRAINPNVKYAAWIYPPACNEPGEAPLAELMRRTYASAFNNGEMWMDMHPYGRDENTLWSKNAKGEEEYRWFEGRVEHLFNCCGFDRNGKGRMIYTECGVDKGSVGGFNQLAFTAEQFDRWVRRFIDLHKDFPQVLGGAIFQYGDSMPIGRNDDKWRGYEVRSYLPTLKVIWAQGTPPVIDAPTPIVTPITPITPVTPAATTALLGVHCMTNGEAAKSLAKAGVPAVLVMNNKDLAVELKRDRPDLIVMYRHFWPHGTRPSVDEIMASLPLSPGLLYCIFNEGDNYDMSPANLEARAQMEVEVARRVRDATGGQSKVLAGGFAMLNPNWRDPAVRRVFRDHYAQPYNSGLIGFDQHTYTPTLTFGFDRDGSGNWRQLFDPDIGFDPSIRAVYSSETGLDEPHAPQMGWQARGGFPALGISIDLFTDWCKRFIAFQSEPLNNHPSPFVAGCLFQHGGNGDPQWDRFELKTYLPALQTFFAGAIKPRAMGMSKAKAKPVSKKASTKTRKPVAKKVPKKKAKPVSKKVSRKKAKPVAKKKPTKKTTS